MLTNKEKEEKKNTTCVRFRMERLNTLKRTNHVRTQQIEKKIYV